MLISGDVVEVTKYEKPVRCGREKQLKNNGGRGNVATLESIEENRAITLKRARKRVRNLINANVSIGEETDKFITLTYADEMTDIKQGNKDIREFIRRLGWYVKKNQGYVKYVAVPEIQQKRLKKFGVAVWHYHLITFNVPYVPAEKLKKIWGHGFVKINRTSGVDNLGAYISKYMTKDGEEKRLRGNRSYFCSRGLNESFTVKCESGSEQEKEWEHLLNDPTLYDERYSAEYDTDHFGKVKYTQYRHINQLNLHTVKSSVKGQA